MATQKSRGPLQRVPGTDMSTAVAVFQAAMLLTVPEDQTQRKAFESLMPYMYVLRNKGCSWAQLTKLLIDCGFALQPSTVRTYYAEMLATRQDICQERMNEQILLLAEIRKETKGADMSAISGRVATIMQQQRATAAPKLDALFGLGGATAPPEKLTLTTPAAREENQKKGLRPVREDKPPNADADGLGRLKPPAQAQDSHGHPSRPLFTQDDAPLVPNLNPAHTSQARAAASPPPIKDKENPKLFCRPLQSGVQPLKRRENNDPKIYEPGDMEHPAIPGLMLSREQRIYGAALEYVDQEDAEIKLETAEEKRFRVTWRRPVPMTETMTGNSFTKMDESLFAARKI